MAAMGGLTRRPLLVPLLLVLAALSCSSPAGASSPTASVVKRLSSLIQWSRVSPKAPHQTGDGGNVLQFESGYLVETLVEGTKLGVEPHTIRVSPEGELFAVDSVNSNIVRITPPLSQYSRARLVAGSFQGYSGHVDGKPSDARFHHPKGVTMDGKGNVYVADTANFAIRKIGEAGVTTIAGGKSNIAGYRDGPSEDAKFSSDFDVAYVGSTCSLLVIDRGNAAIRQISLLQDDCNRQDTSISTTDICMVVGAVLIGYATCLLQQGLGTTMFQKRKEGLFSDIHNTNTTIKTDLAVESLKEDTDAGWPSFGTLVADLSKWGFEVLGKTLLSFVPEGLFFWMTKKGLSPLKDHLVIPEDRIDSPSMQKHKISPAVAETLHAADSSNKLMPPNKLQKLTKPQLKDPLSTKHRSSKRQEYTDFYGSGENQVSAKMLKDRTRHRNREKVGDVTYAVEAKSGEPKPNYMEGKFEHFNIRSKFGSDGAFNM